MKITEDRLHSFIELYSQEFGIVLAKSEAQQEITMLLSYVLMGLEPLAKIDENDISKELD
ncbi:MAG: hypothetical protein K2Q33_02885 [Gammaproteobacteria bacterium]|nr:hypothetical protein [Gammaproteobacteria bacterium]